MPGQAADAFAREFEDYELVMWMTPIQNKRGRRNSMLRLLKYVITRSQHIAFTIQAVPMEQQRMASVGL